MHGKSAKHIEINSDDDGGDERQEGKSMEAGARNADNPPSSLPHSSPPRVTSHELNTLHQSQAAIIGPTNDMFQDDDEFWKKLDAGMDTSLSDVPSAPPTTGPNSVTDEDEDMWNIVDEIEKEVSKDTVPVASGPQPENQPLDDDLDDMYE